MIMLLLGVNINLVSQFDYFFQNDENYYNEDDYRWNELFLPEQHGCNYNYYADDAPTGTGGLLLVGMGLAYLKLKKCSNEQKRNP